MHVDFVVYIFFACLCYKLLRFRITADGEEDVYVRNAEWTRQVLHDVIASCLINSVPKTL